MVCGVSTSANSVFHDKMIRSSRDIELTVVDLPNPKPPFLETYDDTLIPALLARWYRAGRHPKHLVEAVKTTLKGTAIFEGTDHDYFGACHTEAGVMAMVWSIVTGAAGSERGPVELRNVLVPAVCPLYLPAVSHH